MSSYAARKGNAPDQVLIVTGGVGAGHDGAAAELRARLERAGLHVEVRDFLDAVPPLCRLLLREGYTGSVRWAPALFERVFQGIERGTWVHGVVSCCWLSMHWYALVSFNEWLAAWGGGSCRGVDQVAASLR